MQMKTRETTSLQIGKLLIACRNVTAA